LSDGKGGDNRASQEVERDDAPGAEAITADDRRRVLEAIAFEPAEGPPALDPMVLGSLGSTAIEPIGERYAGEAEALASMLRDHVSACPPAVRDLALIVLDVSSTEASGTAAARTALLRCVGAFVMNHLANNWVRCARSCGRRPEGS
jgi:hypothetical protein